MGVVSYWIFICVVFTNFVFCDMYSLHLSRIRNTAIILIKFQKILKRNKEGKYRRENIDERNKAQNFYFGEQDKGFRVLNKIDIVYREKSYVLIISDEPMPRFRPFASYLTRKV